MKSAVWRSSTAGSKGRLSLGPPLIWTALLLLLVALPGCSRVSLEVRERRGVPVPLVNAGHPVDWWFVFKLNARVFPGCGGGVVTCPFGGAAQPYRQSGQQYAVASSDSETLEPSGGDCLGDTKNDPVGATFNEVYNGNFHYVVWSDQFFNDPKIAGCGAAGCGDLYADAANESCGKDVCNSSWAASKGLIAWNDDGDGLVMQVTTPDWPGSGSAKHPRSTEGNTLGCVKDNNVQNSQHFFALRLTKDDLLKVLDGMSNASVATDVSNPQIVNNGGPSEVQAKVAALGVTTSGRVVQGRLSTGVRFLEKPSSLHVPPWQMVSAELGGVALRTATWSSTPEIPTTNAATPVDCWDPTLGRPGPVEIASGGMWLGKEVGLQGGPSPDSNHAKIGVSTKDTEHFAIFGDLNQQGALSGNCASSQNGRGGMFFVLDDVDLANSLRGFLRVPFTPAAPRWVRWVRQNPGATVSLLMCVGLLAIPIGLAVASALKPKMVVLTSIEEIVASDSPVTSLKEDRLGQRALVERLSKFLRNPNTSPPLVLSLQARWGMGKSSVMRMLESDLKENRAAVTVWFNAWHHQREDQLLAYLLETIQKEAIPSWLTPVGLSFRFDLLRVRLFSGIDRLALVVGSISLLTLKWKKPELLHEEGWKRWLLNSAVTAAVLPLLSVLMAFKSNPEKLAEKKGGGVVDTIKELLRLPSLVGKSDVRQEFASNLKDVVEALSPQRLVIFLDDLDRCKPDQVVQILEAINFLSSVASCIIVVGADYEKVETLVAMQFEQIALREAENMGSEGLGDPVGLRIGYARNYLKKIVNLRLNLRLPTPTDIAQMLRERSVERRGSAKPLKRVAAVGVLLLPIVLTLAAVTWWPVAPPVVQTGNVVHHEAVASVAATTGEKVEGGQVPETRVQAAAVLFDNVPAATGWRRGLVVGGPVMIALVMAIYWFSRPRRMEETQDAKSFADALETRSQEIYTRCKSPREVRRFLNYLRLIATEPSEQADGERVSLRKKYAGTFDQSLVDLAAMDAMPEAGLEGPEIEEYFRSQCELFGLDFRTFLPKEAGSRPEV